MGIPYFGPEDVLTGPIDISQVDSAKVKEEQDASPSQEKEQQTTSVSDPNSQILQVEGLEAHLGSPRGKGKEHEATSVGEPNEEVYIGMIPLREVHLNKAYEEQDEEQGSATRKNMTFSDVWHIIVDSHIAYGI